MFSTYAPFSNNPWTILFFLLFFPHHYFIIHGCQQWTGRSAGQDRGFVLLFSLFPSLLLSVYVCSYDSTKSVRHLISCAPREVLSMALETSCIIIPCMEHWCSGWKWAGRFRWIFFGVLVHIFAFVLPIHGWLDGPAEASECKSSYACIYFNLTTLCIFMMGVKNNVTCEWKRVLRWCHDMLLLSKHRITPRFMTSV